VIDHSVFLGLLDRRRCLFDWLNLSARPRPILVGDGDGLNATLCAMGLTRCVHPLPVNEPQCSTFPRTAKPPELDGDTPIRYSP
jgi:hypothetical protein